MKPIRLAIALMLIIFLINGIDLVAETNDLEGPSDWPMYQYNAQHTGFNDKDQIQTPLLLLWIKKYHDIHRHINQIMVVGDRALVTIRRYQQSDPMLGIWCTDIHDGHVYWSHEYFDAYCSDAAAYSNNQVYLQTNSPTKVTSYDLESGDLNWESPYRAQWQEQMGPVPYKDHLVFPAGTYGGIQCIDNRTGELTWFRRFIQIDRMAPAIHNDTVYLWGGCIFQALSISDPHDVYFEMNPTVIGWGDWWGVETVPVIDTLSRIAFLQNGQGLYAVDLDTQLPLWIKEWEYIYRGDTVGTLKYQRITPAVHDGKVYSAIGYRFICFDGLTGEEEWSYTTDTAFWYPPVISNGTVFVSSLQNTFGFDIETHKKVFSSNVSGNLSVGNNTLFIGSRYGKVYAYGSMFTSVDSEGDVILPSEFVLHQNYPNPFNPSTTISFDLPERSHVQLEIFNIMGQLVTHLIDKKLSAGPHIIDWNGETSFGERASSGTYLYRLTADDYVQTRKMILLK